MDEKIVQDILGRLERYCNQLMRECNIREPDRKNGYWTALADIRAKIQEMYDE